MPTRPLVAVSLLLAACSAAPERSNAVHCSTDADCGGLGSCVAGLCPGSSELNAPSATYSSLTVTPAVQTAGASNVTISVSLRDASNVAIVGQSVSIAASGSSNTFSPVSQTSSTNSSGIATFYLQSTLAQTETLTATAGSFTTAPVPVTFTHGALQCSPSPSPTFVASLATQTVSTGANTILLTTTVVDKYNNPVSNYAVTYSCTGTGCAGDTITPVSGFTAGYTNAMGLYEATLSSTAVGPRTIKSSVGTACYPTQPVTFIAASPAAPVLTESTGMVPANGTSTSTLTATVDDTVGNPLPNQVVTFQNPSGIGTFSAGTAGTFTGPNQCTTNASGICNVNISSAAVGTAGITANDMTGPSNAVNVTFAASGICSAAGSYVTTVSNPTTADGVTPMTVTVHAFDTTGQPMPAGTPVEVDSFSCQGCTWIGSPTGVTGSPSSNEFTVEVVSNYTEPDGGPEAVSFDALINPNNNPHCYTSQTASSFSAAAPAPFTAPTGFAETGTCNTGQVTLSWNAVATAPFYHVFEATSPSGPWTDLIGAPRDSPWVVTGLSNNTTYFFAVAAYSSDPYYASTGGLGPLSVVPVAFVCAPPPAPTNVAASGGCGSGPATVTWSQSPTATGYTIYSSTSSSGPFTNLVGSTTGISSTSFTDTSPSASSSYYEVVATNAYGNSPYSSAYELACTTPCPATGYAGGDGSAATPYLICSGAGFLYIGSNGDNNSGLHFQQTANIDLGNSQTTGWFPFTFTGDYDGHGHAITYYLSPTQAEFNGCAATGSANIEGNYSGDYQDPSDGHSTPWLCDNLGLFLGTYQGASIENLQINGATIVGGGTNVGFLIGAVQGDTTVTNVQAVGGSILGYFAVGGLIGTIYGGTNVFEQVSTNNVTLLSSVGAGDASYNGMGGLVGQMQGGTNSFTNCAASGSISNGPIPPSPGNGGLGGLVGNTNVTSFANCVSTITFPSPDSSSSDWGVTGSDDGASSANSTFWLTGAGAGGPIASGFISGSTDNSSADNATMLGQQSTYSGWDFSTIWTAPSGGNAPTLQFHYP